MNKGKCLTLESLNTIPILAMMERSSLPWGIKDKNSRYVYMNAASLAYFNVPEKFDFEGRTEDEFPCRWSALAQDYQLHDRKAEQTPGGAEIITTTYYGKDQILEPNYCPKFPLYSQTGEVLGTIFYTKKQSCVSITDFFNKLRPSVVTLTPPVAVFTDRELEIIFFAIQKMSAKNIAEKLFISPRTVEHSMLKIYRKIAVNCLGELIDYCHHVGLSHYIPKRLIREGINFCW